MFIANIFDWILNNRNRFLIFVFIIALVVRVIFVCSLNKEKFYFSDARHYDAAAVRLIQGDGFDPAYSRAPFYPIFMAGVYKVFGHSFLAMRIIQAILGSILCLLIFEIGSIGFGSRVGAIAALASIFFPHLILISGLLYPTLLFAFLIAIMMVLQLKTNIPFRLGNAILIGQFFGLSTLTEASMIFFIPFYILWLLAQFKTGFLKRLAFIGIMFSVTLLVMSPWIIRGFKIYGRLTLVRPLPHTALPNLENPDETQSKIESGWKETTDYRVEHPMGTNKDSVINMVLVYIKNPWGTIRHILSELPHFWALYPDRLDTKKDTYRESIHTRDQRMATKNFFVSGFIKYVSIMVMLPVFSLSLIGFLTQGLKNSKGWLMFLLVFSFSLGYSMLYSEVRYRIPVEPYILIFASLGFIYLVNKFFVKQQVETSKGQG